LAVMPDYAARVYANAVSLSSRQELKLGEGYIDHFRSLVLFVNQYNQRAFASNWFPPERSRRIAEGVFASLFLPINVGYTPVAGCTSPDVAALQPTLSMEDTGTAEQATRCQTSPMPRGAEGQTVATPRETHPRSPGA